MGVAFRSAQLYLSSELYLVLNIKDDFTGRVVIGEYEYDVISGVVGEDDSIRIEVSPFDFYNASIEITVTSLGETVKCKYSLHDYRTSVSDDTVQDLLEALYVYCYEASVYINGGVIPPFIDTMPSVGVVIK